MLLEGELANAGFAPSERGSGWVLAPAPSGSAAPASSLAFAHLVLPDPVEVRGESVNALAQQVLDFFLGSLGDERVESAWPCIFNGPQEEAGLGRRITAVEKAFHEALRKRLSRVAKLASGALPWGAVPVRGLFVTFVDFGRAFATRDIFSNGQRRMADDPQAPSRSYLKIEEAYGIFGCEPTSGETVADLGAAPGGWSYSAAKRGAQVLAIDNGPLKGGALNHPRIEHLRADAFKFAPSTGQVFDWLFSDIVEEPHHVIRQVVHPWLLNRWCRRFVVNLKFGRVDPLALLRELREANSSLSAHAGDVKIRHLYHDREELTVMGTVKT